MVLVLANFCPIRNKSSFNNAWPSDMIDCICHLVRNKFFQFQALPGLFLKKKLKII